MRIRILYTLPLAGALMLPAVAQQAPVDSQQPASAQSSSASSSAPGSNDDQNMSARQPLEPDYRQGFWGKLNPFARKKYVQRQLSPIRNRVNELDDLTAANAKDIQDVDARAQEGIRQADAKATQADQHAMDAGNRAQQANQTALQASNSPEYGGAGGRQHRSVPSGHPDRDPFPPGQTTLSAKAKDALDDMTADLKDQKGYIIEVQGFSPAAESRVRRPWRTP